MLNKNLIFNPSIYETNVLLGRHCCRTLINKNAIHVRIRSLLITYKYFKIKISNKSYVNLHIYYFYL